MKNSRQQFVYGDRIFVRLSLNGQNVAEFIAERVSCMTELLCRVRALTKKYKGLAQLYVRNMTQGWSMERPLMLYPPLQPPQTTLVQHSDRLYSY